MEGQGKREREEQEKRHERKGEGRKRRVGVCVREMMELAPGSKGREGE